MITQSALLAPPWWLALVLAASISIVALQFRWLTTSGAVSAAVVGTLIYWLGGMFALVPLLIFFVTGSLLSAVVRVRRARSKYLFSGARGAAQVWANAGVPVAIVIYLAIIRGHVPVYQLPNIELLYLAAITAVTADTWATEIGILIGGKPRSLRSWKHVEPGCSGAVTVAGLFGSVAGAIAVPLLVAHLWQLNSAQFTLAAWAGLIASLADSLMGASIQVAYRDGEGDSLYDVKPSPQAKQVRGYRWITNDTVNLLTSLVGVIAALVLMRAATNLFGV